MPARRQSELDAPPLSLATSQDPCLKHGLPESERGWNLEGMPKREGHAREAGWRCNDCGLLNAFDAEACACCGALRRPVVTRRPPIELKGGLRELAPETFPRDDLSRIIRMSYARFVAKPRTERELRAYALAHGYKPGWVWHRLQEQRQAG
jgi:DNA repair protein RadD